MGRSILRCEYQVHRYHYRRIRRPVLRLPNIESWSNREGLPSGRCASSTVFGSGLVPVQRECDRQRFRGLYGESLACKLGMDGIHPGGFSIAFSFQIPDGGLVRTLKDPIVELLGHQKRVSSIVWHPSASNILLTAGKLFAFCYDAGWKLLSLFLFFQLPTSKSFFGTLALANL